MKNIENKKNALLYHFDLFVCLIILILKLKTKLKRLTEVQSAKSVISFIDTGQKYMGLMFLLSCKQNIFLKLNSMIKSDNGQRQRYQFMSQKS